MQGAQASLPVNSCCLIAKVFVRGLIPYSPSIWSSMATLLVDPLSLLPEEIRWGILSHYLNFEDVSLRVRQKHDLKDQNHAILSSFLALPDDPRYIYRRKKNLSQQWLDEVERAFFEGKLSQQHNLEGRLTPPCRRGLVEQTFRDSTTPYHEEWVLQRDGFPDHLRAHRPSPVSEIRFEPLPGTETCSEWCAPSNGPSPRRYGWSYIEASKHQWGQSRFYRSLGRAVTKKTEQHAQGVGSETDVSRWD